MAGEATLVLASDARGCPSVAIDPPSPPPDCGQTATVEDMVSQVYIIIPSNLRILYGAVPCSAADTRECSIMDRPNHSAHESQTHGGHNIPGGYIEGGAAIPLSSILFFV